MSLSVANVWEEIGQIVTPDQNPKVLEVLSRLHAELVHQELLDTERCNQVWGWRTIVGHIMSIPDSKLHARAFMSHEVRGRLPFSIRYHLIPDLRLWSTAFREIAELEAVRLRLVETTGTQS